MRRIPPFQANRTPGTTEDPDLDARFRALEARHVELDRYLGTLLGQVTPVAALVVEAAGADEGGGDSPVNPDDYVLKAGDTMTGDLNINAVLAVFSQANAVAFLVRETAGQTQPVAVFQNSAGVSLIKLFPTSALIEVLHPTSGSAQLRAESYANVSILLGRRAGGSRSSPAATVNAAPIARFQAGGHTGSGWAASSSGYLEFQAAETFGAAAWGTRAILYVTPVGSNVAVNALQIEPTGITVAGRTMSGTDSPAQITSDQTGYTLGNGRYQRLSTDASRDINTITATLAGDERVVINVGSNPLVLVNQAGVGIAADRLITGTGANISLAQDETVTLYYDGTTARWRVL